MKWQYFPSAGIKAPLHQWDMSHYGSLLDLAKMHDAGSRAATITNTMTTTTTRRKLTMTMTMTTTLLLLLLLPLASTMSLDRLALERNELPAAEPESTASVPALVVDDMKMAALPAQGNTDMYMLVPESVASQLDETEHVHRNTIEADAEAENAAVGESADMLMLESDDTPAMQLVELPSDITVAELKPETQTELVLETDAETDAAAEIASPELIEEHVVEQVQPLGSSSSNSNEAQLENAEAVAEAATEAAQVVVNEQPETQPEAEPESETQREAEPETQPEPEPETQSETQPETQSEIQPEPEPETQSETQPETQADEEVVEELSTPAAIEQEVAQEAEPESVLESEPEPEQTQAELIREEIKTQTAAIAENEVEAEATESSMLETIAAGIEEGLSAAASELLPEELNVAETTEQVQLEEQPAEAEAAKQPEQLEVEQLEAQTPPAPAPELEVETATEQLLVASVPAAGEESQNVVLAEAEQAEKEPLNDAEVQPSEVIALPAEEEPVEPVVLSPQTEQTVLESDNQPLETEKLTEVLADEISEPAEVQVAAQDEAQAEPQVETQAEVQAEPQVETQDEPQLEAQAEVQAEPQVETQAEIQDDILAEPQAETQADILAEPQAEIQAELQAEPQLATELEQSMLTTIIPVVVPQMPQMLIQEGPEPTQVLDSVLNYVNASFVQQQPLMDQDQEQELEAVTESAFNAQLRRYDGAQVWRIVVQTDKDKKMADELQSKYDGQLWKEVKQEVDYLLKPQVLAAAERHIRAANLSRIVLIDNLQQVIEVENPPAEKIAELQNRKGHRLTWQAYHRLDDIHGFIDYMAKTYPDICSTETIGYSVEKRPLKILKISNGNARNPGIWIDGGMHAREWISPATVSFIANQLIEGWEDLPEHMRNINWYIHPVANPDGYEYSHTTDRLWRKNMRAHGRQCPGVDLNRNFGYKWGGKGTSASPCSQTYRGSKAFSEPETFYISKFISGFPRDTFQAYLSFHSYGQYILYPWGYDYHLTKDRADLDRVARQAGSIITKSSGVKYTVGSSATTLYPAAGGSDDWAKGIAGIKYAYTIEMGDTGRYGFVLPAQFISYNGRDGYTFADTVARAIAQGRSKDGRSSSSRRRSR